MPVSGKFGRDVFWNVVSFGVLGISGILLNVIIGRFYGASALGVFNQVFALYILLSQFAVFGVHYSVVKHVAEFAADKSKCDVIISSALAVTAACATGICLAGILLAPLAGWLFSSAGVRVGWLCVLPGLWCFAMNKVLLGVLNGKRFMKAFAFASAVRYVLFIVFLVLCVPAHVPAEALPLILSGGEAALLLFLLAYVLRFHSLAAAGGWFRWVWTHLHFGARGFLSGTMAELNSRVDVLMLGLFATDALVGVYSMAAMLMEGFAQLSAVVRNNVNPLLTQYIARAQTEKIGNMVRRGKRLFFAVMALLGVTAVLLYPLAIRLLVSDQEFMLSWVPFAILMGGLILCSGYLPFNMILVQAGYPGTHTALMALVVLTNAILNLLLIPPFGIGGAACATATSFVLSAVYLKILARWRLNVCL